MSLRHCRGQQLAYSFLWCVRIFGFRKNGFFIPSAGQYKFFGGLFSRLRAFFLASFYRPQDGINFWGLISSLACVAFVAFVAILKIHCDYAQFPQFCLFTKLSEP